MREYFIYRRALACVCVSARTAQHTKKCSTIMNVFHFLFVHACTYITVVHNEIFLSFCDCVSTNMGAQGDLFLIAMKRDCCDI